MPEIAEFAAAIAGREPAWLRYHLRPLDPAESGPVRFRGNSISQYDDTTCGSTVIMAARAVVDPLYALRLTMGGRPDSGVESDDGFTRRLEAQEQRIHDETNRLWPQRAGTPPWGISALLNQDPAALGAHHRWAAVVPAVAWPAGPVMKRALAAADEGYPVPILIGNLIPRHYVLLLRHDAWGATFYEPAGGDLIDIATVDLERRDFSELGWPHLHGAILPSDPRIQGAKAL